MMISLSQDLLLKKTILSLLSILCFLVNIILPASVRVYFWVLSSALSSQLAFVFIFMPVANVSITLAL